MEKQTTLLAVAVFMFFSSAFAGTYSGGTGEPNDPYIIATAEDMNAIGANPDDWGAHFLVVADINLAGYTGTQFNIIGNSTTPFTGVFDGNNHKIWNFTWDSNGVSYIGLFGKVGSSGQIKNLGMENVDVNAGDGGWVGGLTAYNEGTLNNSFLSGSISGNENIGGLVGYNASVISTCNTTATVSGVYDNVGGLVGKNKSGGTITESYTIGVAFGRSHVGGLLGVNNRGTVSNCYATSSVSGNDNVGGLVGENYDTINDCYSTGSISGDVHVGGLVGVNTEGTISNCYAKTSVSGGDDTGGLIGTSDGGAISNCYVISNVSGSSDAGGLVGTSSGSTISNCRAKADVSGYTMVGGLIGSKYGGSVSGCFAAGHITANNDQVGGLLGQCDGCSLLNCYAGGDISGNWGVGGLIGAVPYDANVSNCYAVGVVDGNSIVGGLIGYNEEGVVTASFWDVNTTGQLISDGGEGKTTAEMKTESTFTDAGWDFIEIWDIGENQTYPFLRVYPAGDINHDDIVNFYDLAILAGHWLEGTE